MNSADGALPNRIPWPLAGREKSEAEREMETDGQTKRGRQAEMERDIQTDRKNE